MNNLKNIATILPYKENYTFKNAGAASLWVSGFLKFSKFRNNNLIYGHTTTVDYLTKQYVNLNIENKKSIFTSATKKYCENFIIKTKKLNFDIIEIHNRPLIFNYLSKVLTSKFIIYFHNDPLSMKGSKNIKERIELLNTVDKIIFISKWVQKRFFIGLDNNLIKKTEIIYHSVHKEKKLIKKEKIITFVGKLNESKGYDLYGEAIIKILDEYKDWNAFSIGSEKRNRPIIEHVNHKEIGQLSHKKVLKFFLKTEIAVVPSRWEEPFGRTALEASSKGCATIISNRGGLPETTDHCVILKRLTSKELYLKIKELIKKKKLRKKLQLNGFKNVKHLIKKNAQLIDSIREEIIPNFRLNIINKKLKIINIYNQGQKLSHRLYNISLGKKFTNGFIRNGHDVLEISDRDFIKQNRNFSLTPPKKKFQKYLIETFKNYSPDMIFFGHTKNIALETFDDMKSSNKSLIISQWNEDPIMPSLNYTVNNLDNINYYKDIIDHTFITTDPSVLKNSPLKLNNVHYFFIPVDKNIEKYDVFNLNPRKELFYAMSHGVNRAVLKSGKIDSRVIFLNKLIKKIQDINYDFYGFSNQQPIWGDDFFSALTNSKMGLNLSRGKPTKHYSSNRIASLMGNGLLTFIDSKVSLNDFFKNDEIISYNNLSDLADKIRFYSKNDKLRKKIARNGKNKYFKLFNEKRITKFIADISTGKQSKLI